MLTVSVLELIWTFCAGLPNATDSKTAPVVSLLLSVTGFANVPLIGAGVALYAVTVKMPEAPVIAVPDCPLGRPLIVNVLGTYCAPVLGVGVGLGDGDTNGVGVAVALVVAVGTTVGPPDGELTGLADDEPLGIDEGAELGEALEPPALLDVGVGPADALDVGCPPGELLGAVDGTTPPV